MANYRTRWRCRTKVLMLMVAGGLVLLILQRYILGFLTPILMSQTAPHLRVQEAGSNTSHQVSPHSHNQPRTKVVLMHSFPSFYELRSGKEVFSGCEDPCILTLDPELAQEADSIILFTRHFALQSPSTLTVSPNTVLVYFIVESPFSSDNDMFAQPEWHHRFNWTMTYRRDSDFYFGYGDFVKSPSSIIQRDFSELTQNKSKMVAWFVSNCQAQSKRQDYVSALKEFVDVDIYGKCGSLTCDNTDGHSCMDMLSRDYYFYLSFENAFCKDYVTEKLYHIMKMADVVPVVRGGANYSAILPEHSFIDASQFSSVKALADHLKRVAEDKQLYESYLAWKKEWRVVEPMPFPLCELCHRLHNAKLWAHVYYNVDAWWRDDICHEPPAVVKS